MRTPPTYCQYAAGPCDQSFEGLLEKEALVLYGSRPETIASTIEAALGRARRPDGGAGWISWRDLPIAGRIIFCEISKAMRFSGTVVADVTTLNYNLMFEIGFAIGLGLPLIPIRDTTYVTDKRLFDELGMLDTVGYVDFTNSENLFEALRERIPARPMHTVDVDIAYEAPLYVLPGPMKTEGDIRLISAIKKSRTRFRTYDPIDSPRLTLAEAHRQVSRSLGVVAHLISPEREGSQVHNARCALVSGIAMAQEKMVLMLQEEQTDEPIDYRDVVRHYTNPRQIVGLLEDPLLRVHEEFQTRRSPGRPVPLNVLHRLDLGDPAAENESTALDEYFVETGQYVQAKHGHARLVIGRKGSGKTAIFFAIRNPLIDSPSRLIMDLRPEGYQFTKLREFVLSKLSQGAQEHTMAGFWRLLLLTEMARKILVADRQFANRDPARFERFLKVEQFYKTFSPQFDADFSQRLLIEVERIIEAVGGTDVTELGPRLTEYLYTGGVRDLEEALIDYLREKDEVWLLLDNLDKSWPVHGSTEEDILIVRALLESTRKIQERLEDRGVAYQCLVFLRTDIYSHLLSATPDKGKDTAISLEWDNIAFFEEIVARRVEASTELHGDFREIWPQISESHIHVQDTFDYLVERTLMRPRDLLVFLRQCVDSAINRGNAKITVEDILLGEKAYSDEMLYSVAEEIADTRPEWQDALYAFEGAEAVLSIAQVEQLLAETRPEIDDAGIVDGMELLLRFGFLGVLGPGSLEPTYVHTVGFNMRRLLDAVRRRRASLVIHPAFQEALGIVSASG